MKVVTEVRTVSSFGTTETASFTIGVNPKAFKILSAGLYSDKPLALARELGCNAADSHIEAKRADVPFEVHLPNRLEPWFSVKDYGIGMCHKDIMTMYTTYFGSTKTDSDDVTGCLGLGSKSPFAYVDAFTVEARWNGRVTIYTCFFDEESIPRISVLGDVYGAATDEHNGLTIKMPVIESDFREFGKNAKKVFKRFATIPIVTGEAGWEIEPIKYTVEGTNWKMVEAGENHYGHYDNRRINAIQGQVAYPLSTDSLNDLTDAQHAVLALPLDLFFDMKVNPLDITPSRESLGYNKATIVNIKAMLDVVAAELPPLYQARFDDCKTLWEARILFKEIVAQLPHGVRELLSDNTVGLKWNNAALSGDFELSKNDFPSEILSFGGHRRRKPRMINTEYGTDNYTFSADEGHRFFYDDVGAGANSRISYYLEDDYHGRVILLKTDKKKELKVFSKALGSVILQPVSSLPKRPKAERAAARATSRVLKYIGARADKKDSWEMTEVNLRKDSGVFVMLDRWKVQDRDSEMCDFDYVVSAARLNGLIDADIAIYGIRRGDVAKIPSDSNWVNLFTMLREKIGDLVDTADTSNLLADDSEFRYFSFPYPHSISAFNAEVFSDDSPLTEFLAAYNFMKDRPTSNAELIKKFAQRIGHTVETGNATYRLKSLWKAVGNRYPLIDMMDDYKLARTDVGLNKNITKKISYLFDYIRLVDSESVPTVADVD